MEKEKLLILVIDEEPHDHERIHGSFERPKVQAEIIFAKSREDGLALMRQQKFDHVLTDCHAADRDGLTGLYNRRYFAEALKREFERSRRYHRPLSLLMLDLDGFKIINDSCGHPQGDQVLVRVAQIILQTVRFVDIVARYGGDEFAILLPETDLRPAGRLAERLIQEIRANPHLHEGRDFPVSASAGLAAYRDGQDSAGALLKEADEALYEAKRKGRDRVVLSQYGQETLRPRSHTHNKTQSHLPKFHDPLSTSHPLSK